MLDPVDLLLTRVVAGGQWPPRSESAAWRYCMTYRAFRESNREDLKKVAGWSDRNREYKVDPLPERIAEAWGDHLFGEELTVTPGAEADEERLEELVGANAPNDLTEDARAAESEFVVPEGEGWWRIYRDSDVADVPLVEWHSRLSVVPFYIGKRLLACALVSILEGRGRGGTKASIYRHFEIHVDGAVEHVLFRGSKQKIGETVPLDEHGETEDLVATLGDGREGGAIWRHGLPMLMGRIVNKRGRKPSLGKSEYEGIKDQLLDLNEAVTIGAENARLTAKKRVVLPANSSLLRPGASSTNGYVDNGEGQLVPGPGTPQAMMGEDVIVADPVDAELGRETSHFQVLEYSYDAAALIAHKRDLVETALTRVGLTPQWVGVVTDASDGFAVSGTALRLRLIPTDKAGRGKARPWDRDLPRIVGLMQRLDGLPEADGGFGRQWTDAELAPGIARANPLPNDELEQATIESTLVTAGVRSKRTSIKAQHEEWTDEQVEAELEAIAAEQPSPASGLLPGLS